MKLTTKQIREMIQQELKEFKAPEMAFDINLEPQEEPQAPAAFKYTPNKEAAQAELLRQVAVRQ